MKIFVIILNILFIIIGAFSIMLALTSFMIFDAPGSENNPYLWVAFWSALTMPLVCFGSVIVSTILLFKFKKIKKAFWVVLLPLIPIGTLIACMVLIETYCQGNFSC
jgi:hypothetical protein